MSDEVEDVVEDVECAECGDTMSEDDATIAEDGDVVCSDCVRVCEYCGRVGGTSDSWYYISNDLWCEECYSSNAFHCERCESSYNANRVSWNSVNGNDWCEYCLENAYYCEGCDEYNTESDCPRCGDDIGKVHNYSYKPNPIFHGWATNNLYMGFELEMELNSIPGSEYMDAVKLVADLEEADVCYLKSDSSITGTGFELVTHPHTLAAYDQADELWNYIERLRTDYQARSWDTNSCGLHVHVSRAAFRSGAHTHRFLSLVYKNPREMMKLAGRKNSRYANFSDVYKADEWGVPRFNIQDKIHRGSFTERYSAVNTNGDYTLELRFFRGNMKREGIMSALELCHASVEYTRDLSVSDVKLGALRWDWFADWVAANNGTYPNLFMRMSKVHMINLDNRPLLNA